MIVRILLLIFLWMLLRRLWRMYFVSRSRSDQRRAPYPGPDKSPGNGDAGMTEITDQEISEADFEELDDR
jgi:hypothetical protein